MAISKCNVHVNTRSMETTPHGTVDFPVACYEDDMRRINVPVHWHDEFELITVMLGRVFLSLGPEQFILDAGDSVFINSGCLHSVKKVKNGESVLRSVVVHPALIGGRNDSCLWQKLVAPFSRDAAPEYILLGSTDDWHREVRTHLLRAWDAVSEEAYDYENEARYLISRAMRILVDHMPPEEDHRTGNNAVSERMKRILTFIEAHYSEDIDNRTLMELGCCSESVLLRSFKQIAGTPPKQYILNFRIEKAAERLRTTDEKAGKIALDCGFSDVSYFTGIFRRTKEMTPIEYRKAMSGSK